MKISIAMVRNTVLLFFMMKLGAFSLVAQKTNIGSLKKILEHQKGDTHKVNTLIELSYANWDVSNYKNSVHYGREALMLAQKLGYKKGEAYARLNLVRAQFILSDHAAALANLYPALNYFEAVKDKTGMASCLQFMGSVFEDLGDTTASLHHLLRALSLRGEIGELWGIAQTSNTIGSIYCKQGKVEEAAEKHFAALKICSSPDFKGPEWSLPYTYSSIGLVYEKQGDVEYAREHKKEALDEYGRSLRYYKMSLALWQKTDRKDGIASMLPMIGRIYFKLNDFKLAEASLQRALQMNAGLESKEVFRDAYRALSVLDSVKKDMGTAYRHYKLYILYRDSIANEETRRRSEGLNMKYEMDKKEAEIKLLTTDNKLQTALAAKENQNKRVAFGGICVILIVGGYGFYHYRKKKRKQGEHALLDERLRISRELHDELGATLSGIAMYSHMVSSNLVNNDTDTAKHSVNIIQNNASEMVAKLNDIIWLIQPHKESLKDVITKLEEYAQNMCMAKNIIPDIQVQGVFESYKPSIETRKNIYLFCKEAINNMVKHSNATSLLLKFLLQDNMLEITIRDDGDGFKPERVKKGNGLDNMQKRADDIGAIFSLKSGPQQGCTISLVLKITQRGIA